jgi:hypothetical protein
MRSFCDFSKAHFGRWENSVFHILARIWECFQQESRTHSNFDNYALS